MVLAQQLAAAQGIDAERGVAGETALHSATTFWWSGGVPGGIVVGKVGGPEFGSEVYV